MWPRIFGVLQNRPLKGLSLDKAASLLLSSRRSTASFSRKCAHSLHRWEVCHKSFCLVQILSKSSWSSSPHGLSWGFCSLPALTGSSHGWGLSFSVAEACPSGRTCFKHHLFHKNPSWPFQLEVLFLPLDLLWPLALQPRFQINILLLEYELFSHVFTALLSQLNCKHHGSSMSYTLKKGFPQYLGAQEMFVD